MDKISICQSSSDKSGGGGGDASVYSFANIIYVQHTNHISLNPFNCARTTVYSVMRELAVWYIDETTQESNRTQLNASLAVSYATKLRNCLFTKRSA